MKMSLKNLKIEIGGKGRTCDRWVEGNTKYCSTLSAGEGVVVEVQAGCDWEHDFVNPGLRDVL